MNGSVNGIEICSSLLEIFDIVFLQIRYDRYPGSDFVVSERLARHVREMYNYVEWLVLAVCQTESPNIVGVAD